MRALLQRVSEASVVISNQPVAAIAHGFLILIGIEAEDGKDDLEWLAKKITQLRIFSDNEDKMNLDIKDVNGEIIVVSQFTLHAKTKKGNRPSYIKAARPEVAIPLYEDFKKQLSQTLGKEIQSGEFGADMKVSLTNDGPVTIWLDSKNKE
ncbi:MAG: D-aminoacyl-tRNA deacylase [Flavobacteriales bacterium]|jgi:D-tyrosyl-tRNA(Tyr) deacylase|tara:strand:+ start:6885 stop:7337 length:453 start_codon:yes stop_codon:yes gene_type:complete